MSVATRDGFVPRVRVKAEMTAAGLVQRIVCRGRLMPSRLKRQR
jgi:hypothetical protein